MAVALALVTAACGGSDAPLTAAASTTRGATEADTVTSTEAGETTTSTGETVGTSTTVAYSIPTTTAPVDTDSSTAPPTGESPAGEPAAVPGPDWLGTRVLPTDADGRVPPQTTPPELVDRRLVTVDTLTPPPDEAFHSSVAPLAGDPLDRSTWNESCPVTVDELRYVTVSFWGFDGRAHTGELIVNAAVVDDVVQVFERLHDARFPIEEMRVVTEADLDALPTGDGNNTTAFACRAVVGGSRFSEHAYGLAIDVNPFQNPYRRGEVVLPELATAYLDRSNVRPGMIFEGGPVVAAFDEIGWGWGGRWRSLDDLHHFSLNDR